MIFLRIAAMVLGIGSGSLLLLVTGARLVYSATGGGIEISGDPHALITALQSLASAMTISAAALLPKTRPERRYCPRLLHRHYVVAVFSC
jgi:hypothetical protein